MRPKGREARRLMVGFASRVAGDCDVTATRCFRHRVVVFGGGEAARQTIASPTFVAKARASHSRPYPFRRRRRLQDAAMKRAAHTIQETQ